MASTSKKLVDSIIAFVEIKAEQLKLRVITAVAKLLSSVIALSMSVLLGFFCLFFLSFAFAEMMNEGLQSAYFGYFIIAGVYFVFILLMIMLIKSGKLQKWLQALMLKLENTKDEQEGID